MFSHHILESVENFKCFDAHHDLFQTKNIMTLDWQFMYILKPFLRFTAHLGLGFYTLFVQYYSLICRPSDHTVGRPRAENRTRDGQSRGQDSNH